MGPLLDKNITNENIDTSPKPKSIMDKSPISPKLKSIIDKTPISKGKIISINSIKSDSKSNKSLSLSLKSISSNKHYLSI